MDYNKSGSKGASDSKSGATEKARPDSNTGSRVSGYTNNPKHK